MAKKLRHKKECRKGCINADGSENISSKPTELRAKLIAPVTLRQKMQSLWAEFRQREEENSQLESIQDAQDFDVDADVQLKSPYESEGELLDNVDAIAQQSETPAAKSEDKKLDKKEDKDGKKGEDHAEASKEPSEG